MKAFILVEPGFEKIAVQEITRLVSLASKIAGQGVIEVEVSKEELAALAYQGQSFKKVLIGLEKNADLEKVKFSKVAWTDYFFEGVKFKIEVEGVKGQDNRLEISRNIAGKIFPLVDFKIEIDVKNPELVVLVYFDGNKYFMGMDVCGFDLARRNYRVFVNPASLRGDWGYYLIRKSGFVKGEKLVLGFIKDGTVLIEAALFNSGKAVHYSQKFEFAFRKFPLFAGFNFTEFFDQLDARVKEGKVYGFDESMMNLRAARKNAKIAGVEQYLELTKHGLDELDVKFSEGEVDRLFFQITRKDEGQLNEIYHQANYVLRKKGTLMLMGRESWEVTISKKFRLLAEETVKRGDSNWKLWLMERI
ncbi:MAG: THUMP domain-containing protein [Candidatus Woesearchaeota archaeon]